jgi:integrase
MRLSEVLNLSYDDVDFNTRMITSWINKGNKPRSNPMTRRVHEVMQRRCNLPEIFAMTLDQAQRMWKKVRVALGYKDDKQFRHAHATSHLRVKACTGGSGLCTPSRRFWAIQPSE